MKELISLMLALMLVIGCLAGCSGEEQTEGSKIIGVCMQNKSSSIAVLQEEALIEMFEPMGYDVQVVSADDSSATQRSQVETFILMNVEMLVILPCEISTLEDSLIKAREQGIKVVVSGGTGSVSEEAYDAVSSDDEFMVGMYVASVAKTWIEENMDPNGDWEVHFLSSTLSEDAIERCNGEAMILEPWLKNAEGEYVNLMGEVVDEANRIENPVYCEMVAERVESYEACSTQMSMTDNRGVVSGVLTENKNVRVFIAYNSLASTAGSTYITDTYSAEEASEFAFFSGGVMGDEYEYLIGSVSDEAGTNSVFRAACQFGGGDAAATLANLCNKVMFGEAGVDYGKTNPNTIGLYYPIAPELNNGVAALVCFDSPSHIAYYSYADVLAQENLMTYWDSENGYNENMQETEEAPSEEPEINDEPAAEPAAGVYTYEYDGIGGKETASIELKDDGTCEFKLPGHPMITDVYAGTYTREGNVVTITALTNVDESSAYKLPGLWDWIDSATGNAVVTVDDASATFVPGAEEAPAAEGISAGEYRFIEATPFGEFLWVVTLNEDGTAVVAQPENAQMGNPSWTAVWTDNGDGTFTTSECTGDGPMIASFWSNNSITWINNGDGTVTPVGYTG